LKNEYFQNDNGDSPHSEGGLSTFRRPPYASVPERIIA